MIAFMLDYSACSNPFVGAGVFIPLVKTVEAFSSSEKASPKTSKNKIF
jgi:hypothetical protein